MFILATWAFFQILDFSLVKADFQDLPDEIVLQIFEEHARSGGDLESLAKVSRRFEQIAGDRILKDYRERVTTTRAVFTRAPNDPTLGEGWSDPDGLIWYGHVKDRESKNVPMGSGTAALYCEKYDARLPTIREFKDLGRRFGAAYTSVGYLDPTSNYVPQVISSQKGTFWSSSHNDYGTQFCFNLDTGRVCALVGQELEVLCVRDGSSGRYL